MDWRAAATATFVMVIIASVIGLVVFGPAWLDQAQAAWPYTKDVVLGIIALTIVTMVGGIWYALYDYLK